MHSEIKKAAAVISEANSIAALTGAGVSVESGLATFRNTETGEWTNVDPARFASRSGFVREPRVVWQWYMKRYNQMLRAEPNAGHLALAELANLVPNLTIITQNVDDLHERGGSKYVLHLHGSLCHYRCNSCRRPYSLTLQERMADLPPLCPNCFDFIRPDVVWFEEYLQTGIFDMALTAARDCDVLLVVGTSGVVYPAAEFPMTAQQSGAAIIEVNPETTPVSKMADVVLRGPSGIYLPQLVDQVASNRRQSPGSQTN